MLIIRPLLEVWRLSRKHASSAVYHLETEAHKGGHTIVDDEDTDVMEGTSVTSSENLCADEKHSEHSEGAGDVIVHSLIETIEFVLGSISNTASYLRLWALSLAHRQLSIVFFEMTVGKSITSSTNFFTSTLGVIFGVIQLAIVTVGVIMGMDVMECFLHSLRLHWYFSLT